MLNYLEILSLGWPLVQAHTWGDPFIYADLVWDGGDPLPTKAALDAWAVANPQGGTSPTVDWVSLQTDLMANRPAPGNTGDVFLATDTLIMYYDNGTAWVEISSPAYTGGHGKLINMWNGAVPQMKGSSKIPLDQHHHTDTLPTIADGTEVFSQTITPATINSKFVINLAAIIDSSASHRAVTLALFRDNVCINVISNFIEESKKHNSMSLIYADAPATTSAITYSVRVGISYKATWYLAQSRYYKFGGAGASSWHINEIAN